MAWPTHRAGGRRTLAVLALAGTGALAACSGSPTAAEPPATAPPHTSAPAGHPSPSATMEAADRATAQRATAAFQDVAAAEAAGYVSTLDTLGCFHDEGLGGMGLHYLNESLLDATVDVAAPEALVYELDGEGRIDGLVAHEYIVPVDAWTADAPPALFGVAFHRHPTLPLWVLHTWIWKDDVAGVFADWNPAVRLCPPDVPIFGRDLPSDG